jgi:hypothetical protein
MIERFKGEPELPPLLRQNLVNYLRAGGSSPTISQLLNVAAFQGAAIQEVLTEPTFAASRNFFENGDRFQGLMFRRRDLRLAHRQLAYVLADLLSAQDLLPPPAPVWRELGLWGDTAREACPHEHHRYVDRYKAQRTSLGAYRFKMGVEECLRLLELGGETSIERVAVRLRTPRDRQEAIECYQAAVSLRVTLQRSADARLLEAWEATRGSEFAEWTKN